MERTRIFLWCPMKVGFDALHLADYRARLLGESIRHRSWSQLASRANEEFGLQMFG